MPFSERFNPPLTTIRIPHYEIGAAAADLLLERLGEPRTRGTQSGAPRRAASPRARRCAAPRRAFALDKPAARRLRLHTIAAIVCNAASGGGGCGWGSGAHAGRLAIAGALALAVGACGGDDDNGGGGQRRQTSSKPIKIGASLPLTGEFSEPGKAAKQGYEVWQTMVNDAGRPARPQGPARDQGRRVATRTRSSPTTTR